MSLQVPLPWERLLWSGRPNLFHRRRARYILTDLRLVRLVRRESTAGPSREEADEILLDDIADVRQTRSRVDRLIGTSTVIVQARTGTPAIELWGIRRGAQLAAVLDLMSGDPRARLDEESVRAALRWEPRETTTRYAPAAGIAALASALIVGVAIGLHGSVSPIAYSPDDPIVPGGQKRSTDEIRRFMEAEVLPWARVALGPIKGGADRVTCLTCHGQDAETRRWEMPAVAALPKPDLRDRGWERFGGKMDAQMRNAIYGYVAEPEKQARAAYMREVVMPGMARVLRRPAYDFTQSYEYNRARLAFGCYHCHRVK